MSVGAVAHREGRILVQGYNGAPSGLRHCNYEHEPEDCRAVHAEQNAVAWAARLGVALNQAEWVITHEPCLPCSRSLINSGVKSVLFVYPYRLHDGVELLEEAGILVEQYLDWEEPRVVESPYA
jgi:dCMP deaminase